MSAPTGYRSAAWAFIAGATGTTIAAVFIQTLVIPATNVTDDRWSYPWEAGPFVAVSLFYVILHVLVAAGVGVVGRIGVAGTSRPARRGITLAIVGPSHSPPARSPDYQSATCSPTTPARRWSAPSSASVWCSPPSVS